MEIIDQNKKDLPNSTAVLVLGILSLVFCWCYGIVGLILGIIAVALSERLAACIRLIRRPILRFHTRMSMQDGYVVLSVSVLLCLFSLSLF